MTDANTICHDLDLLGDWLDAKGYTEEAGLCTRAMDEINRLYEWKDKAGDIDRVKTVELVDLRAENARLREALRPFAEICKQIERAFDVDEKVSVCFGETDLSNLRAARAAMGETGDE